MKILLVEDDPAISLLIEEALSTHHVVEVAEDGRSALALAEQVGYDLLLLDIGIPEIDGISVCRQLRNQGCQLPILLLTARDRLSDRVMGLDAGADDYMVKPFHMPELLARIRALLRRGRTTTTSVVTWGDLQLNGLTNEIFYGGQLLHLTPKEYGILELLLLHPQQIFSRSAMIEHLWALEATPTESAISSHIKAIRQKLKAAGASQDLIETMYGFGYRLRPGLASPRKALETVAPTKKEEPLKAAPGFSLEATDAAMLELWERFKDSFIAQIDLLDQVVDASRTGHLTAELHQEAKQTVHKLVGSLGVYGFPQGSVLARQIETLLHPDLALEAAEIQQIAQWIEALRQEMSQPPQTMASALQGLSQLPRVLVIDDDVALTERLQAEATGRSLHLIMASNLEAAQRLLDRNRPEAILLDLTVADGHEAGLTWLTTLRRQYPQIPVLVLTQRDQFHDRIAAVRLGAQAFLQKPATVEQIFQAIAQTLSARSSLTGTVMAVDDDPVILHQLSAVLSPWGLQVTTLLDPDRFWDVLTSTAPDLLLLDIEMPGFNGIELCQVVRHDPQWGNLPILFLTAHQEADMIVQAFAAGGDDYIRKPILEPELVARVLNRLEGRSKRLVGG
ncbi:response regulator [Stenomitos frigidus]|uniref:Multi-component transcriptional regulator n=1 Tax=Stenomitos frigidus ULC18 TaxID=2107698 RepID=A0A2T1DUE0_9CYAN|nr:response regulator [Stenomitos frigidus]PSB24123.1 multi-component transcriptional regulator [Stenomitos frigidus ULC18]